MSQLCLCYCLFTSKCTSKLSQHSIQASSIPAHLPPIMDADENTISLYNSKTNLHSIFRSPSHPPLPERKNSSIIAHSRLANATMNLFIGCLWPSRGIIHVNNNKSTRNRTISLPLFFSPPPPPLSRIYVNMIHTKKIEYINPSSLPPLPPLLLPSKVPFSVICLKKVE